MQRNPARNADESAPRARANDGPNFLAMKEPREGVASGARKFVDDHDLRSVNRDGRPRRVLAFARRERGEKLTAELFRVEVRNLAAGIVALVDDDAVLIELRSELLVERDDAGEGGVRHVHIADAAASRLRDFPAVFLHPSEIARTGFAVHRLHRDFPRAFGSGFGIDFQRDEFSGEVLEIGIYVLIRTRFLAVDRDQVVARFHFQSRLGQRRARGVIPVFAGINLRDAEVAAIGLKIGAEHANAHMRLRGLIAAAHIGVRSAQLRDHFADDVIQIAALRYPGKQRFIALANFLPIVAGHVRVPVEVALDAPRFVEYLAPFFAGIDLHLQFTEIELAVVDFGFAGSGFSDAVNWPSLIDDLFAFLVEVVAVNTFEQHFVFALGHVVNVKNIF